MPYRKTSIPALHSLHGSRFIKNPEEPTSFWDIKHINGKGGSFAVYMRRCDRAKQQHN